MEDKDLYIKIAHWYYTLGMTQDEIAKRLSFTRQRVNRIINSLVDMGIVTIKVNGFAHGNVACESLIEQHFGIKRVIIAASYDRDCDYLPSLANTASQYIEGYLQPGMTIGVGWGGTLTATVSNLSFKRRTDCTVVQMIGAQNIDWEMFKLDESARMLANKLDCMCYMLCAPVIVDSAETKKMLMKERSIQKSFELMKKCDIALIGLGEISEDSTMCRCGLFRVDDIEHLSREGFVGDVCANPVTIDGKWQDCYICDRVVSANMDILKKIPNVIAVAGGKAKTEAIIGCLASGVIDTLITDDVTAEDIIYKLGLQNKFENGGE